MSIIRLQHYDVTSCKQRHLIEKAYWCKGVSTCYNHRKYGKVPFLKGVIAFSKKVHVFLETPCKDAHVSLFLYLAPYCRVMPLFDDLQYFSAIFAPNYVTFDPWVWHKKRSDIFQFSPKGF